MDAITFRFLISLVVIENLDMHLIWILLSYKDSYGSLDNDISKHGSLDKRA